MHQRVSLIGNPNSGRGRGERLIGEAERLLRERGIQPRILKTEKPGDAVALAERAGGDAALVLAVGGDGTVRDVAEGLHRAAYEGALGILPGGTGNDLIRTLGIPSTLPVALETALGPNDRAVDLWQWNDSIFLNVSGIGLDAAVAGLVNRRYRNMHGALPYALALLTLLPRFQPVELRLEWSEGEWAGRVWLAAFGNGRCYGGGMQIAPAALPDDGLLDVVLIGDVPRLELLRQFPGIFAGRHVEHPQVVSLRVASVEVQAIGQEATIDGELIGRTPARVRHAGMLRVRVP